VVGLGNPGTEFVGTRHNAGAEVVRALAERHQGRLKAEKGLRSQVCAVRIADHPALLAVPQTFMNESGLAVAPLVRRAGIDRPSQPDHSKPASASASGLANQLIIVHDELDLPSGRVRVKSGGGNAGNNGLRSIESHLHTSDYLRVRIGIGKPPGRQAGADHVLRRPGAAERTLLALAIQQAADAVEAIIADGLEAAMNRINAAG
jgi:PTH1 family peptidyl-tRNA hydrolase